MTKISRCPKRIVEGGIAGELDLGECLFHCAAFQEWKVLLDTSNPTLASGCCKEIGGGVVIARYDP